MLNGEGLYIVGWLLIAVSWEEAFAAIYWSCAHCYNAPNKLGETK